MSNTNNNMQTQTSSALHNAIMEAGGKDRPPMLAPGNYVQWKSRIKRYIDTKPNHELIHFCFKNPPYQYKLLTTDANATPVTPGNEGTSQQQQPRGKVMETFATVPEDIQKWITAEAKAVQIILIRIDNDIYSTVDACPNAMEMWKAIERLKQGESINVQDLETNLYLEFGKFTSQEGESLKSYYSRFYKMINELVRNQMAKNEVNEIRAERLARTANPLALIAQQQPVYHPKTNHTHYTQNSSTISQAASRNKDKAISNSPLPTYDLEPEVVVDDDTSSKEKEIKKLMDLISISNKGTWYDKQTRKYDNQRAVNVVGARANARDSAYHKEKMLLCKQEEAGIQLSAEQVDWSDDTNDEPEDQELEARYIYMAKIQEVTPDDVANNSGPIFDTEPLQKVHNCNNDYNVFANERQHPEQHESVNDTYLVEQSDTNITHDSSDMIEIDASKQNNKSLESSNKALREANTFLQSELTRYQDIDLVKNAREKCATTYGLLEEQKVKSEKSFSAYTEKILNLNKSISEMENELSAHKRTISTILFQKDEQEKSFKTREENELDKVISLEKQVKVLNDIVYKRGQSVQTMIMLNRNCKTSFVKPEYLKKAQSVNPRLYDIRCYNDNLALILAPESDKTIRLAQEIRSKLKMVEDLKYFKSLENEVESLLSKLETQKIQFSNKIDRLFKEYYYVDHVNAILGVYTTIGEHSDLACNYLETLEICERLEIASEPTIKKPRSTFRKLYEHVSKTCSWWYTKITPPGYKWEPKSKAGNVNTNLVEIILFIVDFGCSKNMTRNLKLLSNFMEKFLGTVKFRNDQFALILGYGDLVQGNVTIKRVYYIEGLKHNLFSVGQLCDAYLEVAFRKSTCYVRDLKGNDILTGSRGIDLYSITLQDTTSPNLICLMAKASSSQAWLWHRRLSHLNFDTIYQLAFKE
ncbi:retrovirus-related pol polyprotein from transposon TNT 1-94 [Tanacetum coccineum]